MTWGDSLAAAFPAGRWRARWIWAPDADNPPDGSTRCVVALRRSVRLDTVPDTVPMRMVALSRYVLSVNGVEVARGPVRANPRKQPFDVIDLAPHLREGDNVIGVIAWRYTNPMPWWLPPPLFANDLVHGAFVLEARLGDEWLVTDSSWSALTLPTWTLTPGLGVSGRGRERLDLTSLPASWDTTVGATEWTAAIERRAMTTGEPGRPEPPSYPLGPLTARPIPWPTARTVALVRDSDGWRSSAADGVVAGSVQVDVDGPAGAVVVVQGAEMYDATGRSQPGDLDAAFEIVCDGTRRTVETLDFYGLRGVLVDAPAEVTVHAVRIVERQHDVVGDAAFACSDPRLDQIWAVGRRTVTLCSNDAYVDCPTREQRAWTGDSVVHQMVDLTTNADWSLARWHPRLTAVPRPDGMLPMAVAGDAEQVDFTIIPDWALHWVRSVYNLYRYAGDKDEVRALLPVAEGVVRWFEPFCDGTGVPVDVFAWVIIDWSSVYTEGISASLCGLWGRALLDFAEMADWLGDAGRAGWARETHARLADGFERLWDDVRQRYADVIVDGERQPMASQHAQASAIVGGLAPRSRWTRLVEVMTDSTALVHAAFVVPDGPAEPNSQPEPGGDFLRAGHPKPWWDVDRQVVAAQPFFRYVVHDALAAAGRADLITSQCRDWTIALERCATSWTETWYGGTVSHGWSSTPTRDLMTYVLGVAPATPGYASAVVAPALGDLEWASGSVPTPYGPLSIDVTRSELVVDSPVPFTHAGGWYPVGRHTIARS